VEPQQNYTTDRVLGKGSFGVVYQATVEGTGETVAIKKVFQDKRYKNRELQIMRELKHHPNIVELKHAFYTPGDKPGEAYLNVVMGYVPDPLCRVMKHFSKLRQTMSTTYVKLYTWQIMRGLAHIHSLGICHRDVKPQNLLVAPNHALKVCDFGSAKRLVKGEPNVSYICSRYYRAPELVFGATEYSQAIDVWSAGCVMGEMLLGSPLFPGESGVDQLVEIIKVLGTPSREQLLAMNPNYTEFKFPQIKAHPWTKLFKPRTSLDAIEVISKLLVYDASERLRPMECLCHEFFDELRETQAVGNKPLPELFNFTKDELGGLAPELQSKLTP